MSSPAGETRTLADLLATLTELGWIDARRSEAGVERLVGWENLVVRTADGWIYRFSRLDRAEFARELAVLAAVDGRLAVATPRIEKVDHGHRLMAYRTIIGDPLDLAARLAGTPAQRRPLVRSLATTLASVHDLTLPAGLTVPFFDPQDLVAHAVAARPALDRADRDLLDRTLADWQGSPGGTGDRLLHGDFHLGNMVFSGPDQTLSGLWDFSCVTTGEPSADLRYLTGDATLLAREVATAYRSCTGRALDLDRALLFRLLEEFGDAAEERRRVDPGLARALA